MRPLAGLALLLLPGCSWLGERGRDFGDIFRAEGSVGLGLQAKVTAGELLHLGVGSSQRWSGGWAYGLATNERRAEDYIPLSLIALCINPDVEGLHLLRLGTDADAPQHRCPMVAPVTFGSGKVRKPSMQFWNLEAGVMLFVLGAEVGVNPAEFVDFLLGCLGADIADDDDDREGRRIWIPSSPQLLSER